MSCAFTEYIRLLEPGGEPPAECFEAFWDLLRDALISEMRKKGLWQASPCYLGIYGRASWSEGDALEELLVDFYAFLIRRLRGLKAQLAHKSDIRGLLFLNIRNFLYETQRKQDPLGFRIFSLLQAAIREGIDEGALYVLAGDPKVRNDTLLAFAPESDPRVVGNAELDDVVGHWNDEMLPDLVLAFGRGLVRVRSQLKGRVLGLGRQGVEAFRFCDLIEPLKNGVRTRWRAVWQHSEGPADIDGDGGDGGDGVSLVRWVHPDAGFDERQSFQQLLACVGEAIERPEERTARLHLYRLWLYLRSHAAESLEDDRGGGKPPSKRTIAKHLGISRNLVSGLLATLGRLVEACRDDTSGKSAVRKKRDDVPGAGERTKTP